MKARNTVLGKILQIFLALVIPWMAISILLINTANKKIIASNVNLARQSRNNTLENIDTQLLDIALAAKTGNTLEKTFYLSVLDESLTGYDRVQITEQIYESLDTIFVTHGWTENARIYSHPLKRCFNSQGQLDLSGRVQPITDKDFERIASLLDGGYVLATLNGKAVFLIPNSQHFPSCILEVDLSEYQLSHYLQASLEYPSESLFSLSLSDDSFRIGNISNEKLYHATRLAAENLESESLTNFSFDSEKYWLYLYRSSILGFTYFELIPASLLTRPTGLSTALIFGFICLSMFVIIIFFIQSVKLIHRPLQNLISGFDRLRQGNLTVRAQKPETADFYYLYDSFNHMASELEQLVSQNYKQQILLQKAELSQLQAQINPHFLYNNFFWLQRVISSGDIEQAEQITQELGTYFRYITRKNSDLVFLSEENDHAKIYCNLQAIRFSDRIRIDFDELPSEFANLQVPKLILQPLIENSFKYGLETQISNGILRVQHIKVSDEELIITVEDNGKTLTNEKLSLLCKQAETLNANSIPTDLSGMMNIARRLQIYYQSTDCFLLSRSELGGLCTTIRLCFKSKTPPQAAT